MSTKESNNIGEPSEVYDIDLNLNQLPAEDHFILDKLFDIGLTQIKNKQLRSHDEVMKEIKIPKT